MKDNSIAPSGIAEYSVDSTRSYEIPPHLATETTRSASSGRRLLGALTGDSNRRPPGFHSLSSGAAPSSLLLSKRFIFPLFALLAVGLLFLLSGVPLLAQDSSTIEYPENGEGAVATFTATDPETSGSPSRGRLAGTGGDAEDFEIDKANGVLTFAETPDYEMAVDGDDEQRVHEMTVVATDADRHDRPRRLSRSM